MGISKSMKEATKRLKEVPLLFGTDDTIVMRETDSHSVEAMREILKEHGWHEDYVLMGVHNILVIYQRHMRGLFAIYDSFKMVNTDVTKSFSEILVELNKPKEIARVFMPFKIGGHDVVVYRDGDVTIWDNKINIRELEQILDAYRVLNEA